MSAPLYLPAWKLYGAWPAAATDHRPHRGYPRTDQTRRIIYTRRRRSGDRPRSPNFPSMTLEATQPAGRISFCFVARITCETVSIRHAMFSTSTRGGEREERFNIIYIYCSWRSRKCCWTIFRRWRVGLEGLFCRVEERKKCRSRSGKKREIP